MTILDWICKLSNIARSFLFEQASIPFSLCLSCGFTSSNKCMSKTVSTSKSSTSITFGRMELDTCADMIVFGWNFLPLYYTGTECTVTPYTDHYEPSPMVPMTLLLLLGCHHLLVRCIYCYYMEVYGWGIQWRIHFSTQISCDIIV